MRRSTRQHPKDWAPRRGARRRALRSPEDTMAAERRTGDGHEQPSTSVTAESRVRATTMEPPTTTLGPAPSKRWRLLLLLPILLSVTAISITIAWRYWYDSTYFVMTDNAQVSGDLVQVGSLNAGRIASANLQVGSRVQKDQVMAVVAVPQEVGAVPFSGTQRLDETGSTSAQVPVRSPLNGVVAAQMAYVGATVSAGHPIYALVDPERIWVNANIEESKISRVQWGQPAEVHIDALDQTFPGRVEAVTPASAATFSLLPSQNVSGNFTKVTQYVPVKIVVESGDAILPLGTSAQVRIQVREPVGGVPWQP